MAELGKGKKGISRAEYDELKFYFKYACSAYHLICPKPNGRRLVDRFMNLLTDTQGLIARDDDKKEFVVALRGSTTPMDFILDAQVLLIPFVSPGVTPPDDVSVHFGFITAWNSVSAEVIKELRKQLEKWPDYTIVTTGHSLGGALSLLAAVSLQKNFPQSVVRTYSYGAPRVGNKEFAHFIRDTFGDRAHRVVHTNDGVPTMIPEILGYHHHGTEYWLNPDPASPENTTKCSDIGEDPSGSASIPTRGINLAHTMYFGIVAGTPFCM